MKRLIDGVGKNSVEEYNRNFFERCERGPDEFDLQRWKMLIKYYKGGRLIDLGCLDSLVPVYAKEKYPYGEFWGIDVADEAVNAMRENYPYVNYLVGDVYNTKLPSDHFDYAVAGELIEHLERPEDFLKETFRILKEGGMLAISTPLEEAQEPGAKDAERHIWSYSVEDIRQLLSFYDSVKIKIQGSKYFPRYKYNFPNIIAYCKKYGN